jgi:hypothetical protein
MRHNLDIVFEYHFYVLLNKVSICISKNPLDVRISIEKLKLKKLYERSH